MPHFVIDHTRFDWPRPADKIFLLKNTSEVFLLYYSLIAAIENQVWRGQVLTIFGTRFGGLFLREMAENGHLTNR